MTRMVRLKFRRLVFVVAIGAGVLGLAVGTTAAASAGTGPTPSPTITTPAPAFGLPGPHKFQPEQFDVLVTTVNPQGEVDAFGPVACDQGTDQFDTPWVDAFDCGNGDTVTVDHARLPLPWIDPVTCSVIFTQNDAWWRFNGGTGADQGAEGRGVFDLRAVFSFEEKDGRCPVAFDSPWMVRSDIERGGMDWLGHVVKFAIIVQATGKAEVPEPKPEPCPTETFPVYGMSPGHNYGEPSPTCSPSPLYG